MEGWIKQQDNDRTTEIQADGWIKRWDDNRTTYIQTE